MSTRSQLRLRSAGILNRLSQDDLFNRFQVTRVGEITGLDNIGVPVWSGTRPCGRIISVTAGKSLDSQMARAGAIGEAIEYSTFENPRGEFQFQNWTAFNSKNLWLAKGADWAKATNIPVEHIIHWKSGKSILFPSDLVWLGDRSTSQGLFQRTSNGQAVAGSFEEAFLAGLYECVERDAITIRSCGLSEFGCVPPKYELTQLSGSLAILRDKCKDAGLELFLFNCTYDIPIPVYWAILIDRDGLPPFAGWGCNLICQVAAERAILEAIQSRLVYISGARDDIQRRNFDLLRNRDPRELIQTYKSLPATDSFYTDPVDLFPQDELTFVLKKLCMWERRILYKHILLPFNLHAVKVFVLGLEAPITPMWQPGRWNEIRDSYLRGTQPVRSGLEAAETRTLASSGRTR